MAWHSSTKSSSQHDPWFGFLVGEGTRTDINPVTSAYPRPQAHPSGSPGVSTSLASCSHGNRPQRGAQSWRRAAPESSLGAHPVRTRGPGELPPVTESGSNGQVTLRARGPHLSTNCWLLGGAGARHVQLSPHLSPTLPLRLGCPLCVLCLMKDG